MKVVSFRNYKVWTTKLFITCKNSEFLSVRRLLILQTKVTLLPYFEFPVIHRATHANSIRVHTKLLAHKVRNSFQICTVLCQVLCCTEISYQIVSFIYILCRLWNRIRTCWIFQKKANNSLVSSNLPLHQSLLRKASKGNVYTLLTWSRFVKGDKTCYITEWKIYDRIGY